MKLVKKHLKFGSARSILRASLTVFGLGLVLAASQQAAGGTNTGNMIVTANIDAACSVSAAPLAFATVVPGIVKDVEAIVSATCTSGTTYTLDLGNGANHSTTVGTTTPFRRQMLSGANLLPYGLYQEPTRVTAIDASAAGVATNNFLTSTVGNSAAQTRTVYGRIFAAESLAKPPGSYTDTVIVTVAF